MSPRLAVVGIATSVVFLAAVSGCSKSTDKSEGRNQPTGSDPATAPASPPAAGAPSKAPARSTIECAKYVSAANEAAKSANLKMTFEAGSWGGTAAPLQELPAGATLCAGQKIDTIATAVIQSPLFGGALKAAYDPIMTKAGCTFRKDTSTASSTSLTWDCPKDKGGTVTINTERDVEYYALGSLAP